MRPIVYEYVPFRLMGGMDTVARKDYRVLFGAFNIKYNTERKNEYI